MINWYCDMQLKDYRTIFKNNPEVRFKMDKQKQAAGLDALSRRFSWLKRLLKTFDDDHAGAFPNHWFIAEYLCEKFCLDTR